MVSGFASLAGSVLGAYIKMGVSAPDLITASVMSAPGSLAIAKLIYPQIDESKFTGKSKVAADPLDVGNVVEAASKGIIDAIPLVANIAAMLIGFNAFIYWLNDAIFWMGECVGYGMSFNILKFSSQI